MEEVFIARYELNQPRNELMRKGILEKIQENGKRNLSVYELSWLTGADIFFILKAMKQLNRDLISVRVKHAFHWCYLLWGVAWWMN